MTPTGLGHPLARTLLVLTFVTGILDAVTFIALGFVFATIMTGNVVILGFAIAGDSGVTIASPLVALGAFLVGAYLAGIIAARQRASQQLIGAALIEAGPVTLAAILALALAVEAGELSAHVLIGLLALAGGLRTATMSRIGLPDLATTVITAPMIELVRGTPAKPGAGQGQAVRIASIISLLLGAVAGALLLKASLALALAVPAALAAVAALAYGRSTAIRGAP